MSTSMVHTYEARVLRRCRRRGMTCCCGSFPPSLICTPNRAPTHCNDIYFHHHRIIVQSYVRYFFAEIKVGTAHDITLIQHYFSRDQYYFRYFCFDNIFTKIPRPVSSLQLFLPRYHHHITACQSCQCSCPGKSPLWLCEHIIIIE